MAMDYRAGANFWLEKYTRSIPDLSQRDFYQNENINLQEVSGDTPRLLFFGSQIIKRWDVTGEFPDYETINRGIDGQWAAGLLLRFQTDVVNLQPDIVIIEISSYNLRPQYSLSEIQEYLKSMVAISEDNSITPVITTMIGLRENTKDCENCKNYSVRDSIIVYNNWIKKYATDKNILMIDFNNLLSNEDGNLANDLSMDAIDPNHDGYKVMTEAVKHILEQVEFESL